MTITLRSFLELTSGAGPARVARRGFPRTRPARAGSAPWDGRPLHAATANHIRGCVVARSVGVLADDGCRKRRPRARSERQIGRLDPPIGVLSRRSGSEGSLRVALSLVSRNSSVVYSIIASNRVRRVICAGLLTAIRSAVRFVNNNNRRTETMIHV
ncbi:hypothetical protein EVAR_42403_1 [Eumeta japonica]|uniref:Uncharacterized protein n=1 Tax=Eumeta variegata TaxID=151549 RepID=A0A4C1X6T9_EUMVA|nr:hypothetical protein EVAR_42403_1 [Eumeta japonica]